MLDGYIRGLDLVCSRVKANNLLRSSFTTVSCHNNPWRTTTTMQEGVAGSGGKGYSAAAVARRVRTRRHHTPDRLHTQPNRRTCGRARWPSLVRMNSVRVFSSSPRYSMIFLTIHGRILDWMMLWVSTTCQLISYAKSSSRSCARGKRRSTSLREPRLQQIVHTALES